MSKVLTDHTEIRQWVEARAGSPLLMDVPDGRGGTRPLLQLTFGQDALNSGESQNQDRPGGFELASWDDWFAALESQNLALRVSDDPSGGSEAEFEFAPRP